MSIALISPSIIRGTVLLPASKSFTQRALALALLHNGKTLLHQVGQSKDERCAIGVVKSLGAAVTRLPNGDIEIISSGSPLPNSILDCGESALCARLFSIIAAISNKPFTITGKAGLLRRSMRTLEDIFPVIGITSETNNGYLPAEISGPLMANDITIDASSGSQYLSGLLIAFAAVTKVPVQIAVNNLVSKPYIDLTLSLIKLFGYRIENEGYENFIIYPRTNVASQITINIERDWSSASFMLLAGALAGDIQLKGLNPLSSQGDKIFLNLLSDAGVSFQLSANNVISINNHGTRRAFNFDATDYPDLFPPLAILAAYTKGASCIKGLSRLHGKESDRSLSVYNLLRSLGIEAEIEGDEMIIHGGEVHGGRIQSYGDHRIAMAAAVAGLGASGDVIIEGAEVIDKSYPVFFDHLASLGASVSLKTEIL